MAVRAGETEGREHLFNIATAGQRFRHDKWFSKSRVASCDGDRRPPVDSASLGKKDPAW
jgi:hypothetical protein